MVVSRRWLMVCAHVFISGLVQGVNFRNFSQKEAQKLRITGWVKNLSDGRLEARFEGPKEYVKMMINWCRHGPPKANVEQVDVEWGKATGEYEDFTIHR